MAGAVDARLREIPRVRQHPDSAGRRRWFTSAGVDLYVWEREGAIERFELYYGKPRVERMLAWDGAGGLRHGVVYDGERDPMESSTPIVVAAGDQDRTEVALEFERVGAGVEPRIYRFVLGHVYADG